jgi:hypothetical protein
VGNIRKAVHAIEKRGAEAAEAAEAAEQEKILQVRFPPGILPSILKYFL